VFKYLTFTIDTVKSSSIFHLFRSTIMEQTEHIDNELIKTDKILSLHK